MRRSNVVSAALVFVVVVASIAGLLLTVTSRDEPQHPDISGFLWPNPPQITSFSLRASDGTDLTENNLIGRWTLVFFGFTHCPDICPTTLATLNQIYLQFILQSPFADKLQVLFVSVDPERDNDAVLENYVKYFNPDFIGATAANASLREFTDQFGTVYMRIENAGIPGYSMGHSASILLVDPELRFVGIFPQPHAVGEIAGRLSSIVSFVEENGE